MFVIFWIPVNGYCLKCVHFSDVSQICPSKRCPSEMCPSKKRRGTIVDWESAAHCGPLRLVIKFVERLIPKFDFN